MMTRILMLVVKKGSTILSFMTERLIRWTGCLQLDIYFRIDKVNPSTNQIDVGGGDGTKTGYLFIKRRIM